jgi:hypothetical protein
MYIHKSKEKNERHNFMCVPKENKTKRHGEELDSEKGLGRPHTDTRMYKKKKICSRSFENRMSRGKKESNSMSNNSYFL